jgi:cell division inhibitor SepF
MAGASFKKLVDFIWGEQEDSQDGYEEDIYNQDYSDEYENEEENEGNESLSLFKRKKVVSIPQPQQIKMKISKPTNFDQADEIVNELKDKNAVVINLEYVSKDVARRIVDVVSGAVKALDGNIEKVSNSIFVVAPYNYDIVNEITKEKIENKFSASWIK